MNKSVLFVILVLLTASCGENSTLVMEENDRKKPPEKPKPVKKVEAGFDLTFQCLDSFNQTVVMLEAVWNATTSIWSITLKEYDRKGKQIETVTDLIGESDETEKWRMHISAANEPFAKIVQNGEKQAIFQGKSRSLVCSFK